MKPDYDTLLDSILSVAHVTRDLLVSFWPAWVLAFAAVCVLVWLVHSLIVRHETRHDAEELHELLERIEWPAPPLEFVRELHAAEVAELQDYCVAVLGFREGGEAAARTPRRPRCLIEWHVAKRGVRGLIPDRGVRRCDCVHRWTNARCCQRQDHAGPHQTHYHAW